MSSALNKSIITASPILGACALYYLCGLLGMVPWLKLALSASIAITEASFAQAATTASLARVRFWRSRAMGRFARDAALAFSLSIPISVGLHARFVYLSTESLQAVFRSPVWDTWLTAGRGWATWFSVFVMCIGALSLVRLVITKMRVGDDE